jgi:hypothetical protein
MINTFTLMALGHFVGDFLAQPRWMALGKSAPGWGGVLMCLTHVAIYALCVMSFADIWSWGVFLAIAIPHYIVDRHSLARVHMRVLGTCKPKSGESTPPYPENVLMVLQYVVIDATIHLLFLYGLSLQLPG